MLSSWWANQPKSFNHYGCFDIFAWAAHFLAANSNHETAALTKNMFNSYQKVGFYYLITR